MRGRRSSREMPALVSKCGTFCRRLWSARTCPRFAEGGSLLPRAGCSAGGARTRPPRGQVRSRRKARTSPRTPKPPAKTIHPSLHPSPSRRQFSQYLMRDSITAGERCPGLASGRTVGASSHLAATPWGIDGWTGITTRSVWAAILPSGAMRSTCSALASGGMMSSAFCVMT